MDRLRKFADIGSFSGEAVFARGFYVFIVILFLTTMAVYDTPFHQAMFVAFNLPYISCFLFSGFLTVTSYFVAAYTDPGRVTKGELELGNHRPTSLIGRSSLAPTVGSSGLPSSLPATTIDLGIPRLAENGESALPSSSDSSRSLPSLSKPKEGNNSLIRLCNVCKIYQPLRSKHCFDCRSCIRRYDHHCPFLATCVGERNHRYYFFFILLHTMMGVYLLLTLSSKFKQHNGTADWLEKNALLGVTLVLLVVGVLVFAILLCCHMALISVGQTTWEFSSRERITYYKGKSVGYHPFDEGVFQNVRSFFFPQSSSRDWHAVLQDYERSLGIRRVNKSPQAVGSNEIATTSV